MFTEKYGWNPMCWSTPGFLLKSVFFKNTLAWGATAPKFLHLPLQTRLFPPSQSKVLRTKERDDIRPQISKRYWSGTGISRFILPSSENLMKFLRFILPLLWKCDEIWWTCMKSLWIIKDSLILFLLSLVP